MRAEYKAAVKSCIVKILKNEAKNKEEAPKAQDSWSYTFAGEQFQAAGLFFRYGRLESACSLACLWALQERRKEGGSNK